MKCAHCGSDLSVCGQRETDTIYCQRCTHRTRVSDGQDDLVVCSRCGRLRDRTAFLCRWCRGHEGDGAVPGSRKAAVEQAVRDGAYRSLLYFTPDELREIKEPA